MFLAIIIACICVHCTSSQVACTPFAGSVDNQQDLIRWTTTSGTVVHPGDSVTFVCTTIDSYLIGWSSDEYIGRGGVRLELHANATSRESSQVSTATAVLLNTSYNSNSAVVLTSALMLIARVVPYISVTCINIGREVSTPIRLNISGTYYALTQLS